MWHVGHESNFRGNLIRLQHSRGRNSTEWFQRGSASRSKKIVCGLYIKIRETHKGLKPSGPSSLVSFHPLTKWLLRRFRLPDFSRLCWNKTKSCPDIVMTIQFMDYAGIFVTSFQFSDIWKNMTKICYKLNFLCANQPVCANWIRISFSSILPFTYVSLAWSRSIFGSVC